MRDNEVWLSTDRRFEEKRYVAGLGQADAGHSETRRVVIIGGGASGTLLAIRLLREPGVDVVLIERSGQFGRGLAYSAPSDRHVLNVVPMRLSAFEDEPAHFWNWLIGRGRVPNNDRFVFLPRRWYGDYLEATLADMAQRAPGRLQLVKDEVVGVLASEDQHVVELASGRRIAADACVLATGHDGRVSYGDDPGQAPDLPLLVLGTGLSMIDHFLANADNGPMLAMSRHGLLPRAHASVAALSLRAENIPFGAEVSAFTRWLRQQIRARGDWRQVLDALRPFVQRIWGAWSLAQRARFLRHARSFWDVHRHRAPPGASHEVLAALAGGALTCLAAVAVSARPGGGRQTVSFRARGSKTIQSLEVREVVDCRGVVRDWSARPDSLVGRLVQEGTARLDRLGLGIEVTPDARVIGRDGSAHATLFAIGPLGRGTFFEIEAIPEIRAQCDRLASLLRERRPDHGYSRPAQMPESRVARGKTLI